MLFSSRPTRDALDPTPLTEASLQDTASGRRQWDVILVATASEPCAARPAHASPRGEPADSPRSTSRWRTWPVCLHALRGPRSTPRRWPRFFRTDTAPGRRQMDVNVVTIASEARAARLARALLRGVLSDRPRSTRTVADLAWLSSRPAHDALHPTPLAETLLHRLRARSATAASDARGHSALIPCHAAHARFTPWRTDPPPTEHARAGGLGVVVFSPSARRAPPHAVGRGFSALSPSQVGGCWM